MLRGFTCDAFNYLNLMGLNARMHLEGSCLRIHRSFLFLERLVYVYRTNIYMERLVEKKGQVKMSEVGRRNKRRRNVY